MASFAALADLAPAEPHGRGAQLQLARPVPRPHAWARPWVSSSCARSASRRPGTARRPCCSSPRLVASGIGETRAPRSSGREPGHALIHRKARPAGPRVPRLGRRHRGLPGLRLPARRRRWGWSPHEPARWPSTARSSSSAASRSRKVPDRLPPLPLGAACPGRDRGRPDRWPRCGRRRPGSLVGAALLGLGVSFSTPAFFSAIFATAGPSERGAASGTASACLDLGLGGGPIALGFTRRAPGHPLGLRGGGRGRAGRQRLDPRSAAPTRPSTRRTADERRLG